MEINLKEMHHMQINLTFEHEFDELYNNYAQDPDRAVFLELEGISRDKLDIAAMSKEYFTHTLADVSVDQNANANENKSPNNYASEVVKGVMKLDGYYLLWKYAVERYGLRIANKLIRSVWDGDIYFHDPTAIQVPYCWAYSTTSLMVEGRPYGQLNSLPPKRADSFIAQVIEMTMDVSNQQAGAVAVSDLIVNYAWYAKREGLTDKQIVNDLQKAIHVFNNKFRASGQSPFVNISLFDRKNLATVWGEHYYYPDGTQIDIEYIIHIQKLFGNWFAKGDPKTGLPYRFPVVSVNIAVDDKREPYDMEFFDWVCEANVEKGIFNIYGNEGTKIASCCRLTNNFERMKFRADTFGSGGLNLGSHRVVTINLPRLALRSANEDEFFKALDNKLETAKRLLIVHREDILQERVKGGFLQFFNPLQWFSLKHFFSTVGIIGVYEMTRFMGLNIKSEEGEAFVTKVLTYIEKRLDEFSEETKHSFNCEEIPGESTAGLLAKKDRVIFGAKFQPFELYSNQYIPLIADATIMERIKLTGKFMKILSGGGILHLNMSSKIQSKEQMKKLLLTAFRNGVEHCAVNYGFGECEDGHVNIVGNDNVCPVCGKPIKEWMTRIIGYFTKISSWNSVRRDYEFPRRKFKLSDTVDDVEETQ
jgi:ribonucleoside-triphosphate reductase